MPVPVVPVLTATIMRPQGTTGVQTHFQAFARYLGKVGHPARIVTPYDAALWQVYPAFALRRLIDPLHKPASVWWYREVHAFFLRRALRQALADGAPCVVYAQCPLSARAALLERRSPAQRVVMVIHFNLSQADEWADKGMFGRDHAMHQSIQAFEARVLPQLDGLVSVSRFMRDAVAARIPAIRQVPLAVVPNFVADPGEPQPLAAARRDLIAIGTLEPRKNQAYLLDILAAARLQGRELTLTLVGDGPDRAALQARALELGVQAQVDFAGFVAQAALRIPEHRACIHAARMESFGIVLIEAMGAGRPVFAPAVGGMPEVFEQGVQGAKLPLDDAAKAAGTVLGWLGDVNRLQTAARSARQRFLTHYESSVAGASLLGFLLESRA